MAASSMMIPRDYPGKDMIDARPPPQTTDADAASTTSSSNSDGTSSPLSPSDAAIIADAFRKRLRKPSPPPPRENPTTDNTWRTTTSNDGGGLFSSAEAAVFADAFNDKRLRNSDFASGFPSGGNLTTANDALTDTTNDDPGVPFSGLSAADAIIIADAFRRRLRKPDFGFIPPAPPPREV